MLPLEIVPNKLNSQEKEQRAKQLLSLVGLEGFEEKNLLNYLGECDKEHHYVEH